MPQDAFTINYLTNELSDTLKSAKVTKVLQPEKDEIDLNVYTLSGTKKLVLSADGATPRCHFTSLEKSNPITAPAFCMLLRKYLTNASITSVKQLNGDRIIEFSFYSKNEMQDYVETKLIIELMSGQSNVIFTDGDYTILGAIRKNSLDDGKKRCIMTGVKYILPESSKQSILSIESQKLLDNLDLDSPVEYLLNTFSGFSYNTAKELVAMSEINGKVSVQKLKSLFADFNAIPLSPSVAFIDGKPKEFTAFKYSSQNYQYKSFKTLNEAIDAYFSYFELTKRIKERSKRLLDVIKTQLSRAEKKLAAQNAQMNDSKDLELDRLSGELITANIYKLKYGDSVAVLDNYYVDPSKKITVKLDKNLSPSDNAQKYYKKYAKKKRTIENLTEQLIESNAQIAMLKNVRVTLNNVTDVDEIKLIEDDLVNAKILTKTDKKKKDKVTKAAPYEYKFDGFTIFVGRNSTENEYVTHKLGRGKDIWFHVKKMFGSHVLLKYENKEFTDEVYVFAAELAAYYSEARNSEKVEVDYTEVKNVKKPPNGKLGLVIYNTNYSMAVKPNAHLDKKTK